MTGNQKFAVGALAAMILLYFAAKKLRASVDFEAPTVSGPGAGKFGGTGFEAGYGVERPLYGPPDPYASETEIQRMIRISNEAGGGDVMAGDGFLGLRAPDSISTYNPE